MERKSIVFILSLFILLILVGNVQAQIACVESDGGDDPYVRGIHQGTYPWGFDVTGGVRDACRLNNNQKVQSCTNCKLMEYYCREDGYLFWNFYTGIDCDHGTVVESCVTPTDDMVITEDTTFCSGTYNLPNGIEIDADNITLDCNNAVLEGDMMEEFGIRLYGDYNNVNNCIITDYQVGIYISSNKVHNNINSGEIYENEYGVVIYGQYNLIDHNVIIDNMYRDINLAGASIEGYNTIQYNEIGGADHAIYFYNQGYNNITQNTITSMTIICASIDNNVTTVGNRIWNNDFYDYGITTQDAGNLSQNIFCVNGVGNNYYNGATGPTC
jgi:hypothetical protein